MNQRLINGLSKLFNSDLVKSIYPMIDRINNIQIIDTPKREGYDLEVSVYLNDPEIDQYNMYKKEFDPHYLADIHLKNLSNYLGFEFNKVGWKLYDSNGKLILNWSNHFY